MKDKNEIIREISEEYPVLSDEEKNKIFDKAEQKLISGDVTGEQVSGVEKYKPQIYKYIGIAAAFLLLCGAGTALYMNVRPSRSPESFNVTEETTEESIQETAEEFTEISEEDINLQEIEDIVLNTIMFDYTLYNPDIIDENPISFNIVNEDGTDFESDTFYLMNNFETIEDLKDVALGFMTESCYGNTVVNYLGDKSDISTEEEIKIQEFFGDTFYVPSTITYNGRLYTNSQRSESISEFDFDTFPVEIIENNSDSMVIKKQVKIKYNESTKLKDKIVNVTSADSESIEGIVCYCFELVKTENGWRVNEGYSEPIDESETEEPLTDTETTEPVTEETTENITEEVTENITEETTEIPEEITDSIIATEDIREDNLDENDYNAEFFLNEDTLTSESAEFTIKNNTENEISYGMEFKLEKIIDGEWTVINYDQYFIALAGIIEPHGSAPFTAHFENPLDSGTYRITKDISGEQYFVEFEIQ